MIQIINLADKDFRTAIITMLKKTKKIMVIINLKNIRNLSKEIETIEKKPNGKSKSENKIAKI